jgi:hypothetical protein
MPMVAGSRTLVDYPGTLICVACRKCDQRVLPFEWIRRRNQLADEGGRNGQG